MTGKVEAVVTIFPKNVSLKGAPGQTLKATVTISPSQNYPFSILEMTQRFEDKIKAKLVQPTSADSNWQIQITSTSEKTDDVYDVITLKTDSKLKPKLVIRVYAVYSEEFRQTS